MSTFSHVYHHTKAILYQSYFITLMFAALWWKLPSKHSVHHNSYIPYKVTSIGLVPSDVTSIQLPHVGPSNSVFFSTHSSYRLDKINSDMRNYITNFAADLRWIQAQCLPSPYLSVAAMLQWSAVKASWHAALLTYSIWTPHRANTQDQSMRGYLGQSSHAVLPKHTAQLNTI